MKYLKFIIIFCICSCVGPKQDANVELTNNPISAEGYSNKTPMPEISIPVDDFNFGDIIQGESATHNFLIKNIGNNNLIISSAKGSCGCTVPEWPKSPILPGKEAYVKVVFNSAGKIGKQKKTVTLLTNAIPATKVLTVSCNVLEKKK